MSTASKTSQGWGWPYSARLEHYFMQGTSLCGRWEADRTTLTTSHVIGPQTCPLCATAKDKHHWSAQHMISW